MSKVALVQMTSTQDLEENLKLCLAWIAEAAQGGASLVALPEAFLFLGNDKLMAQKAESLDGPLVTRFCEAARKAQISLLLGGFPERDPQEPGKIYNNAILIGQDGQILASYRKIHLFDAPVVNLFESNQVSPGRELVTCQHQIGKLGLAICYDLRFPGLFQKLREQGAEVILLPAAFTHHTGLDHWLPLLQARAIENQVYIGAPAQWGWHNQTRRSFGHTVWINPWGQIQACLPHGTGLVWGEVDLEALRQIRSKMPVWSHRVTGVDQP